jgi:hypothetical protein
MRTREILFDTGHVVRTADAVLHLLREHVSESSLFERHQSGDFGDVPRSQRAANARAIAFGGRIHSCYDISSSVTVCLITDADRSTTIVLRREAQDRRSAETAERAAAHRAASAAPDLSVRRHTARQRFSASPVPAEIAGSPACEGTALPSPAAHAWSGDAQWK